MTCFLTPDGRPFFCGTYYPKAQFLQLLSAVAETWRERRGEVEQASDQITGELRKMAAGLPGRRPAGLGGTVRPRGRRRAARRGRRARRVRRRTEIPAVGAAGGAAAQLRAHRVGRMRWRAVERTCTAMARGGIYDQLAGGFARYSVDNAWVVPHFEKMLYDNALLLRAYAHWARRTGSTRWPAASRRRPPTSCCDDLADGDMFTSSLDADADGHEGSTYVWTPAQLREVLGDDDGRWAASVFAVTAAGTFEHGASVLQLPVDADDAGRLDRVRAALLAARADRVQPARDDKVVTAWNGLAITALAEAVGGAGPARTARRRGTLRDGAARLAPRRWPAATGQPRRRSSATAPRSSRTTRHWRRALLTLYQLTGERHWLTAAVGLIDTALAHFADPDRPGRWFDTADDAEAPDGAPGRSRRRRDTVGSVVDRRGAADRRPPRRRRPRRAVRQRPRTRRCVAHTPLLARAARSAGHWLAVAEATVRGPLQIAVACDAADSPLLAAARRLAPGGTVVVGGALDSSELLAGPRPGRRCRRGLCVPRPGVRSAGHRRRGPRYRAWSRPCSVRAMSLGRRSPRNLRQALPRHRSPPAPPPTSRRCMPRTPPWKIPSVAARCTSGGSAIEGFYKNLQKAPSLKTELLTFRSGGHEAAFVFALTVAGAMRIEPIEVMTFDGDGKITVDEGLLVTGGRQNAVALEDREPHRDVVADAPRPRCTRGRTRGGRTCVGHGLGHLSA